MNYNYPTSSSIYKKNSLSSTSKKVSLGEDITIKTKSPFMYNRGKLSKLTVGNKTLVPSGENKQETKNEINSDPLILKGGIRNSSNDELQTRIKQLEEELSKSKLAEFEKFNKIKSLEREVKTLKKTVGEKETLIIENETRMAHLRTENSQLRQKVESLNRRVLHQRINISSMEEYPQLSLNQRSNTIMMALLGMQEEANQYHNDENEIEGHLLDEICPNPDEMTYEELLALQEKIGYVSKGLTQEQINKIPMINYSKKEKNQSTSKHENDTCSVCQYEYNEGERLRQLRCGHAFHKDCVDEWLKKEKKCPVCNHEY